MEMRASRPSGGSYEADDLALCDPDAFLYALGDPALMGIRANVAVGMPDDRLVAIRGGPSGLFHNAVACGHDRRPLRSGKIGPSVRLCIPQYRIHPSTEVRSQTRVWKRCAKEQGSQTFSFAVIIVNHLRFGILKPVECSDGVAESGPNEEQLGVWCCLTLLVYNGKECLKLIGRSRCGLQVDLGRNKTHDLVDHLPGHSVGKCCPVDSVIDRLLIPS